MTTATYQLNGAKATIFRSVAERRRVVIETLFDHCGVGTVPGRLAATLADRGISSRCLANVLQALVDDGAIEVRRVADGVVHVRLLSGRGGR